MSVRAVITKHHILSDLIENGFLTGGWRSKIKLSSSLVSSKASLLGWQVATPSVFCLPSGGRLSVTKSPPLINTPVILGQGPPNPITAFYLNYVYKDSYSKQSLSRVWGLGLQHINMGMREGAQFSP